MKIGWNVIEKKKKKKKLSPQRRDYSQNHAISIRRTCCVGRSIVEWQGWGNDRETIGLTGEIHSDCDLKVGYISGKKQFTPSSMVQRPGDLRNRGHMILRGARGWSGSRFSSADEITMSPGRVGKFISPIQSRLHLRLPISRIIEKF